MITRKTNTTRYLILTFCFLLMLASCGSDKKGYSSHIYQPSLLPVGSVGDAFDTTKEILKDKYYFYQLIDYIHLPYFEFNNIERYAEYMKLNDELDIESVITKVNIGLDKPYYKEISRVISLHSVTLLVNKYTFLPRDFIPSDLVTIPSKYADWEHQAKKEAVTAFIKMAEAAAKEGIFLKVTSAYRSYNTQKDGYDRAINSGRTIDDVDRLNARPGHSEHQTGLAIDVNNTDFRNWVEGGAYYEYGIWLKENAPSFGFIIRYPEGKEDITGYHHEAWHLRYLGITEKGTFLSLEVSKGGLTYDEYYVKFLKKYTVIYLDEEQKQKLLIQ